MTKPINVYLGAREGGKNYVRNATRILGIAKRQYEIDTLLKQQIPCWDMLDSLLQGHYVHAAAKLYKEHTDASFSRIGQTHTTAT